MSRTVATFFACVVVLLVPGGVVALVAMLVAFTIWLLSNAGWCDPDSLLQGHAAWHLLCAVSAYWLYRLYASERQALPST